VYKNLPVKREDLELYLRSVFHTDVAIAKIHELEANREKIENSVYGFPFLIEMVVAGIREQIVLHTLRPDTSGNEQRSDRAQKLIMGYDTFNKLDLHVSALDLGMFLKTGIPISLGGAQEFFLITRYVPGRLFAEDLKNLLSASQLLPEDRQRVLSLSKYLSEIHAVKFDSPSLYHRTIRVLLGQEEGIMSLIDSYPTDLEFVNRSQLQAIEQRLIDWRWRLKSGSHRLSQVHGDFHPGNILFQKDNNFNLLNRGQGEWGEPADDISALSMSFIYFSLRQHGTLRGVFRVLFDMFWDSYLQDTQDIELNRIIQPFYVRRALMMAHPVWHPALTTKTRLKLFTFIENILNEDWFDPGKINSYLGVDN